LDLRFGEKQASSGSERTRIAKARAFGKMRSEFRNMAFERAAANMMTPAARPRRSTPASLLLRLGFCAVLATGLAGCLGYDGDINHGYQLDPTLISQIKIGSSAEQVLVVMGTPSTTSTVGGSAWYYISQSSVREYAFQDQKIVDQHVLAVYFDSDKKVTRVANYGLKDGKIFDFVSRTTPTGGADSNIVSGLFHSLLRFN
jgi:outer membrane protein assembly factor BamE (lipoprotein component of BamABCDE complex)